MSNISSLVKNRQFKREIWKYYAGHKRDFPWRRTRDPYKIFVSEIMLQQTRTSRVMRKFGTFINKFPTFTALARASRASVLAEWSGLGYNRRALSLKAAAEKVVKEHRGRLPGEIGLLLALPGVGRGTAGALLAFAFNKPSAFIETNIRRVFIHFFFRSAKNVRDEKILPLIEATADSEKPREWFSALMDYGAMLAGKVENPNRRSRAYRRQPPFKGSDREARGRILKTLLACGSLRTGSLADIPRAQRKRALHALLKEGFIQKKRDVIRLNS